MRPSQIRASTNRGDPESLQASYFGYDFLTSPSELTAEAKTVSYEIQIWQSLWLHVLSHVWVAVIPSCIMYALVCVTCPMYVQTYMNTLSTCSYNVISCIYLILFDNLFINNKHLFIWICSWPRLPCCPHLWTAWPRTAETSPAAHAATCWTHAAPWEETI